VTRAHRDEPESNRPYAALAQHDGVAVIPARAAKPRDQAQVEVGGHVVARWRLARLRHHPCFSLAEGNAALQPLLPALNARPFKTWPGSRQALCAVLERPALRPLPLQPSAYAAWKQARVNLDAHVDVDGHDSSVPDVLVKQPLDGRVRAHVGELFSKGTRMASHQRSPLTGRHRTVTAPRPTAPQHDAAWTPQRRMHWATHTGPATAQVVETMLASRAHPPQGVRAC
jgi:transposase